MIYDSLLGFFKLIKSYKKFISQALNLILET